MSRGVSIIITTRNRAESLRETLASMTAVRVPAGMTAELLVVDNGSSDHTADVARAAVRLGEIAVRYVSEPRTGQCHARNSGIAASRGDAILFTDDDVRPPLDWIERMCGPILRGDADAVGGGSRLARHLVRPWMEPVHYSMLASTEASDLPGDGMLLGANMGFARYVLNKVPAFDTEIGPGQRGFGDDTLFGWQVKRAGFRIAFLPDVTIEHHPNATRLTSQSMYRTAERRGETLAYLAHHWEHTRIGVPLLRYMKANLHLRRVLRRSGNRQQDYFTAEELHLVQVVSFLRHYTAERRRPRNYERYGLQKLTVSDLRDCIETGGVPVAAITAR